MSGGLSIRLSAELVNDAPRRRMMQPSTYAETFFAGHQDGSVRSAAVVVPLILRHFRIGSVVDVGCGIGAWLAEFSRRGIADYLGIDGDYVSRDLLRIPADRFRAADLADFEPPSRQFDLACSLEVAEHLPADCAARFIARLVDLAPVVLFSAAIPDQGGTNHVNEQWQSYWAGLFRAHGYVGVDCIRPFIFNDDHVELWYRQNTIVFCRPDKIPPRFSPMTSDYEFDRVDPELLRAHSVQFKPTARSVFRDSKKLIRGALRNVMRSMAKRRNGADA
jgi:SAM-dependent methyltransferase